MSPQRELLGQRADGAVITDRLHDDPEAQRDISQYLAHRYSWIGPHQLNGGLQPAVAEEKLQPTVRDGLTATDPLAAVGHFANATPIVKTSRTFRTHQRQTPDHLLMIGGLV